MSKNKKMPILRGTQNKTKHQVLLELAPLPSPEGFEEADGPLSYQMTNDAMFHIVFEACPDALTALVSALLRLSPDEITSIEVTNPVTYDFSVYSKNFVLDLKIILNEKTILNIEMQVEKLSFWKERSLAYLCRIFDNLNRGDEYLKIKPAIQISILDFELSPDDTSFYSSYYMLNEVTHKKYSDNLRLSVLQLRQAANATEEDRIWHLDLWAQFFKANTWEEVFMVAEKDPYIKNAAKTLYRASEDERIRALCEGRERGELTMRTLQLEAKQILEQKQQLQQQLQQQSQQLQQQSQQLQQHEEDKAALRQQYEEKLQQHEEEIARLRTELTILKQQGK